MLVYVHARVHVHVRVPNKGAKRDAKGMQNGRKRDAKGTQRIAKGDRKKRRRGAKGMQKDCKRVAVLYTHVVYSICISRYYTHMSYIVSAKADTIHTCRI